MMGKKRITAVTAAALVATGTAIGVTGLVSGTAHAQPATSVTITGMAQTGPAGNPEPEVVVSVTCPAGTEGQVGATIMQGAFYRGETSLFACTGSPQNETAVTTALSGSDGFIFAGPVSAGASLWLGSDPSGDVGTTATVTYP